MVDVLWGLLLYTNLCTISLFINFKIVLLYSILMILSISFSLFIEKIFNYFINKGGV